MDFKKHATSKWAFRGYWIAGGVALTILGVLLGFRGEATLRKWDAEATAAAKKEADRDATVRELQARYDALVKSVRDGAGSNGGNDPVVVTVGDRQYKGNLYRGPVAADASLLD